MLREQRLEFFFEMPHSDIKLPKRGNCRMEVRSREGRNIPHFHIEGKSKKFHCAVCLDEAKYFKHGKWKDELNNDQKELLQKALMKKQKNGETLWEKFVNYWNSSKEGSKNKVDICNMPDYTKLDGCVRERGAHNDKTY